MAMNFNFRNTVACLHHLIPLRKALAANGVAVPTLIEINRSRTDRPCQYCELAALDAAFDLADELPF